MIVLVCDVWYGKEGSNKGSINYHSIKNGLTECFEWTAVNINYNSRVLIKIQQWISRSRDKPINCTRSEKYRWPRDTLTLVYYLLRIKRILVEPIWSLMLYLILFRSILPVLHLYIFRSISKMKISHLLRCWFAIYTNHIVPIRRKLWNYLKTFTDTHNILSHDRKLFKN